MTFDPTKQPGIRIVQLVTERASFGHRADYLEHVPSTHLALTDVKIDLELGQSPDQRSGLVRCHVYTGKDSKALYEFDVVAVGLVEMDPDQRNQNMTVEQYLATSGAALLYPFIRELIANLSSRGRFGPIWLAPLNIYAGLGPLEQIEAANR